MELHMHDPHLSTRERSINDRWLALAQRVHYVRSANDYEQE
jgi:hypothetical protein